MGERPKLRPVQRMPVQRGNEQLIVLRDPFGVAESFGLDAEFAPVLELLDGQRTVAQIGQSLRFRGIAVERDDLDAFVAALAGGGWLDDDVFRDRWRELHDAFSEAAVRLPAHAGVVYPSSREAIEIALPLPSPAVSSRLGSIDGLLCPYQPFERAPSTFAAVLAALPDPAELDNIVVLATDHAQGLLPVAMVDKPHRTPLGDVPVARDVCRELSKRCPWLTREQLRHRHALGPEMAAVLLARRYGDRCPPIVPLLCGQSAWPDTAMEEVDAFLAASEVVLGRRRVLWLTMAELGHIGPAFGQPGLTPETIERQRTMDRELLDLLTGSIAVFRVVKALRAHAEDSRLSSAATLALLMQLLPAGVRGAQLHHDLVAAVGDEPGVASVAAMAFHRST